MVTLLVTTFFILVFLALAIYFWQKPATTTQTDFLPPRPNSKGLFPETITNEEPSSASVTPDAKLEEIRNRAQSSDYSALEEARDIGNPAFYDSVLTSLAHNADGPGLLALASYVSRHELPVNRVLAEKAINSWSLHPGRGTTAKMLHIAALSNDAAIYRAAIEATMRSWTKRDLANVSAQELRSMFDSEFWVLSPNVRNSGAGFVLKRTLANARRELEAAEER